MEEVKYRYTAIGRTGSKEVFPQNGNTLVISWEKEKDNALFRRQLKGKMTFTGDDYHWLDVFEKSQYRCDPISLVIEKKCNGILTEFFTARLILNRGTWDEDQCSVDIDAEPEDRYTCYNDNKDTEYNLFGYVFAGQTIQLLQGTIETVLCSGNSNDPGSPQWCGEGLQTDGWVVKSLYTQTQNDVGGEQSSFQITWVREVINSEIPLSEPWIFISANKYARQPALYGYRSYGDQYSFGYDYQVGGTIDHGMKLFDIMTMMVNQSCNTMVLKSKFFNWNTNNPDHINYVTGQTSKVENLLLFQKSDVKRPSTSNNASIANITFEKILTDICNIFQLKWDIDEENNFIIEHVSFFQKGVGLNLVGRRDFAMRLGLNQYSYDIDNMPKREVFSMMDDKYTYGDFKGYPIVYSNSCVGQGDTEDKTYQVENIMTDVSLALNNPTSDSPVVSDDGFVLIACDSNNHVISGARITDGNYLNNSLSWARLHLDYWRYNRIFTNFSMNNSQNTALSVVPTKKGIKLPVSICCGESFDPETLITTSLGNGSVSEAEFSLYDEELTLTLLYVPDVDLSTNNPPIAVDDVAVTFKNLTIDIDVLENDSDSDGTINPATLEILFGGSNGYSVVIDGKIRYTPNADYVGNDLISYRVSDNFTEPSNNATVKITVKPGSPLPIAGNDNYVISKNKVLTVGNILDNDTGDGALSTVAETKATTAGGSVTITGGGSFTYTPLTDYIGADSFDYTLKDSNNNIAPGHVSINVFESSQVYARYSEQNPQTVPVQYACSGGLTIVGTEDRIDQHVDFYSDSSGTVPLDITGYALTVGIQAVQTGDDPGTYITNYNPTGTGFIEPDKVRSHHDTGCDNISLSDFEIEYSLVSSPDYIIL